MISKKEEKKATVALRRRGLSYGEILKRVPVAKSTLSLWLRSVGLSKRQKQRLTEKRIFAALKGAAAKRDRRILLTRQLQTQAHSQVGVVSKRELWLIGVALYWAEGSKEKAYHPGSGVSFMNSDPNMIALFLRWLSEACNVERERMRFEIYIHESHKENIKKVRKYWSSQTGFPIQNFSRVYFKKDKINTKRKNIGNKYFGVLRVKVSASSTLQRQIEGWTRGIYEYCRVV